MQTHEIESHTNFLLSAALNKCRNLEDAQDLTQDTLLAALTYISNGNVINDARGWLLTVLNRKFYYKLRQKYKISVVSIGSETDIIDETNFIENIVKTDDAEAIRRSIAYMSKLHREVIVRHYMNGDSVEKIANELGVPQGTVKSRLSTGRDKIKKELDNMETYTKQSYEPINLYVANSGNSGMNDEPGSLVNNDLIAQNLLYLAYNEPTTEADLAKAMGIPLAYLEPIIKRLVDGELLKTAGGKVYTDFIIYTHEDREKYVTAQVNLVSDNKELFLQPLKQGLKKLRSEKYLQRFTANQINALELFFMFRCLDGANYNAFSNIYNATQTFPDRPNGGKWVAFGSASPQNYSSHSDYAYAGERWTYLDNYLGSKSVEFHVYDPEGLTAKTYFRSENGVNDDELLKLLHIIESGINPSETGFNVELLKSIPWLVECKILRYENDKATVDIPVLSADEFNSFAEIVKDVQGSLINDITELLTQYLKGKKQAIPKHLTSVPLQKQYLHALGAVLMATVRQAIKEGIIYDGVHNQCPCPMVYVIL